MSGAGKSILTAGILRVLTQDGFSCAPFKSQNMALNSFVTKDGKEMGRAQVVQAAACHKEPSCDMNPILLKPMGDTTSQVIVNGLPIGNMRAADYFKMKKDLIPDIKKAYDNLSETADIIVIEGAGSPVEINLRENDIVNMGLAEILDAPVLLAGNIDPGGVFAQLLGTVNLMSAQERARVKGLIINKFRGDVSLLTPGLSMFGEYCDIPFAGVVPYVSLELDEEDSVSEKLSGKNAAINDDRPVKICVVKLPFISNYTDFSALERVDGVNLIYAKDAADLGDADLIILPGTKNTVDDLMSLYQSNMASKIIEMKQKGTLIMGICGGFQMLGRTITGSDDSENKALTHKGLGLLPIDTEFVQDKILKQTAGTIGEIEGPFKALSGAEFTGYEIHMGRTGARTKQDIFPVIVEENVLGTYIHGIFDSEDFCRRMVGILYAKKGSDFSNVRIESAFSRQERELDKLADVLRENLDFDLIYRAIGIEKQR